MAGVGDGLSEADFNLDEAIGLVSGGVQDLDGYLNDVLTPSLDGLDRVIESLDIAKSSNIDAIAQVETDYTERVLNLTDLDKAVGDTVLQTNLQNQILLDSITSQRDFLNTLEVNRPGLWDATGGLVARKASEGLGLIGAEICAPLGEWVRVKTQDTPVAFMGEIAEQVPFGLVAGVAAGFGDVFSGIDSLVSHPKQALEGIGALIGRNPHNKEWSFSTLGEAWGGLAKAIFAVEDFQEGNIGKGIGRVGTNILMFVMGAEQFSAARPVLSRTYALLRAQQKGVLRAGLGAALEAGKEIGMQYAKTISGLPRSILSTPGRIAEFFVNGFKNLKLDKMGRLGESISQITQKVDELTGSLREMTVGGRKIGDIPRLCEMNSDEIAALTGNQMAELGITEGGGVRELFSYQRALIQAEQMERSLLMMRSAEVIGGVHPDFSEVPFMNASKMRNFVRDFSAKNPDVLKDYKDMVLAASDEAVLLVDDTGTPRVFDNCGDFTRYLRSRGNPRLGLLNESCLVGNRFTKAALVRVTRSDMVRDVTDAVFGKASDGATCSSEGWSVH